MHADWHRPATKCLLKQGAAKSWLPGGTTRLERLVSDFLPQEKSGCRDEADDEPYRDANQAGVYLQQGSAGVGNLPHACRHEGQGQQVGNGLNPFRHGLDGIENPGQENLGHDDDIAQCPNGLLGLGQAAETEALAQEYDRAQYDYQIVGKEVADNADIQQCGGNRL